MKTKAPLISVIITNYNYEKFIGEAIESVLNQTYENIELIVIDDGSTDGSRDVIKKYEKDYPDIRILLQENKGVVPTRNRGLKEARGEFLIFIDADDTIPSDFIVQMYNTSQEKNADVVCCDLQTDAVLVVEPITLSNFLMFAPTPICQLIRVGSIPNNVRFDKELNRLGHEDIDFFFALYLNNLLFVKCETTKYLYNVHGDGRSPDISGVSEKHEISRKYIYGKYLPTVDRDKLEAALVDVLIKKDSTIFDWISVADERYSMIKDYQSIVGEKDREAAELRNENESIYRSKRYAIGSAILYPISIMKKISKGGK